MKTQRIEFRVSPVLATALATAAALERVSVSKYVRNVVEQRVHESLDEVAASVAAEDGP